MIKNVCFGIAAILILALALPAHGEFRRYTIVTEVIREKQRPLSRHTVVTLMGEKGRIDISSPDDIKEKGKIYLMTLDSGKTAVLGNNAGSICSEWVSEAFFREMGKLLLKAKRWGVLDITELSVGKVFEKPGPELLGYPTTHIRLVITARVLIKFHRYSLEIIDDVWMAPNLIIHPIEQEWINAQTNTGFDQLDQMLDSWNNKLPATILKIESKFVQRSEEKKEEITKLEKITITSIENPDPSTIPSSLFDMPECKKVSTKKMKEAAESMLRDFLQ